MLNFMSFAFWAWLYIKCTKKWPEKEPEWASRVVTLLHGSVATVVGAALCGIPSIERCSTEIGLAHYAIMTWSWGYFAFDLMWCFYYWPNQWLMLFHHLAALWGISTYMKKPNSGCTFPCGLAALEITNPLLQTRWFLRDSGYNNTTLFFIIEVTYLVMFICLRAFMGSYVICKVMNSNLFALDEKFVCLLLYIVSIALVNEILGYVLYKYKTKLNEFGGFLVEIGLILDDQV